MAKVYRSIEELVGKTPLLDAFRLRHEQGLYGRLLLKLEYLNPAGSVKDRAALRMIREAETSGRLKPGGTIIEPTSGNTGIGLAALGVPKGYRVILTMPDTMSAERRKLLAAYGAELVLTEGAKGMQGAVDRAKELAEEIPDSFIPDQFGNPANARAHEISTGPEIWEDTDGQVDVFVAGIGTGGTITGTGRYLKRQNPKIKVIAVEPASSPLLSEGKTGAHGLQGIGANFVPELLDTQVYDEIVTVTEDEAYEAARCLACAEGILTGISSGAALWAAMTLAADPDYLDKNIVVLLPDTGDRYLSTSLYEEESESEE
jgi:cysteine synthase A